MSPSALFLAGILFCVGLFLNLIVEMTSESGRLGRALGSAFCLAAFLISIGVALTQRVPT